MLRLVKASHCATCRGSIQSLGGRQLGFADKRSCGGSSRILQSEQKQDFHMHDSTPLKLQASYIPSKNAQLMKHLAQRDGEKRATCSLGVRTNVISDCIQSFKRAEPRSPMCRWTIRPCAYLSTYDPIPEPKRLFVVYSTRRRACTVRGHQVREGLQKLIKSMELMSGCV